MRYIQRLVFVFIVLAAFALSAGAHAQSAEEQEKHVAVSLTPEFTDLQPAQTLYIAIHQDIDEGWHTYWRNAGDSGEAPHIEWQLPAGFEKVELHWPVPERISLGPLTNYGYEDEVTLVQEILVPTDIPEGPLEIKANIDLLVCAEICIPEYHEAGLVLNEGRDEINSEAITAAFRPMPIDVDWNASYRTENDNFIIDLDFEVPGFITRGQKNVSFDILPYEWGVIDNNAVTGVRLEKGNALRDHVLTLIKPRGDRPLDKLGETQALITFDIEEGKYSALEVTMKPDPEWLEQAQAQAEATAAGSKKNSLNNAAANNAAALPPAPAIGFAKALLFALIGGLILNLMPCVFPVLSMKALSLVQMSEKKTASAKLHGLLYTAGVLVSFAAIAGLLIAFKTAGAQIGWGFQLQNPLVVLLLSYLLFMIGLNLSGFYEISGSFTNVGAGRGKKEGIGESFLTGILATIVATPCTAPFMGVAMGFAMTQPPAISIMVFLALGFGLALPYLLLCFFPALRSVLPRPGRWMITFRELLAFPLYGSAVWLIWVYSQQTGALGLLYALTGFVGLSFAVWIFRSSPAEGAGRVVMRGLALLILFTVLFIAAAESLRPQELPAETTTGQSWWQPFTPASYETAIAGSDPVFVNMTAAWCITCKVNERVALNIDETRELFKTHNVQYLKGDWTNQNPEITAYLSRYGRNGVPLYIFYGSRDEETGERPAPEILPQILTPGIMAGYFNPIDGE